MIYNKPSKTPEEIISLLEARKLIIEDKNQALKYLQFVGHFRLSGYYLGFYKDAEKHIFKDGVTFGNIIRVYEFDRELRVLLFDALERIEVAFRTILNNEMCKIHERLWILKKSCYDPRYSTKNYLGENRFNDLKVEITKKVDRSSDSYIEHYKNKYSSPATPPCWTLIEIMEFGSWSKIYYNLQKDNQKLLEVHFGVDSKILASWIESLCFLRNLCAHHNRVWNRVMLKKPMIAKNPMLFDDNSRVYASINIVCYFLEKLQLSQNWNSSLMELFQEYPEIDKSEMGFPMDFQTL